MGSWAGVVDGADVAAVEAQAGAGAKHLAVGRVRGWEERLGVGQGFEGLEAEVRSRVRVRLVLVWSKLFVLVFKWATFDCGGVVVVHRREAVLFAESHGLPDFVLGDDEVGQTFADLSHASERSNVYNG